MIHVSKMSRSWLMIAGAVLSFIANSGQSLPEPRGSVFGEDDLRVFTVTVLKKVDGKWQEQPDSSLKTTNAREALRYATEFKIKEGWTARTDAIEDVSEYRFWEYVRDSGGNKGYYTKRGDIQWIEVKHDKVFARFEEVKRTEEYVQLYDRSRDLTLRLYPTEVQWKTADLSGWALLPFAVEGH